MVLMERSWSDYAVLIKSPPRKDNFPTQPFLLLENSKQREEMDWFDTYNPDLTSQIRRQNLLFKPKYGDQFYFSSPESASFCPRQDLPSPSSSPSKAPTLYPAPRIRTTSLTTSTTCPLLLIELLPAKRSIPNPNIAHYSLIHDS